MRGPQTGLAPASASNTSISSLKENIHRVIRGTPPPPYEVCLLIIDIKMFCIYIFSLLHLNHPLNQQRRQLSNHPAPPWLTSSTSPSPAQNNLRDQLHQTPDDPPMDRTRPNLRPQETFASVPALAEVLIFSCLNPSLLSHHP